MASAHAFQPASSPPPGGLPPLPPIHQPSKRKTLPKPKPSPSSASASSVSDLSSLSPNFPLPSTPKSILVKNPSATPSSRTSLRTVSTGAPPNIPQKTVRRAISVASFPQPPQTSPRSSAVPSSNSGIPSTRRPSADNSVNSKLKRGSTRNTASAAGSAPANVQQHQRLSKPPSLLNGSGDGKSIPTSGSTARNSEGQISIPSPPRSRSSSAQGSYSTSATTLDDADDAATGPSRNSSKPKEAKGNVIVSVRVRPDFNANETHVSGGEWAVEGKKALISLRGKEGSGDYFYGK